MTDYKALIHYPSEQGLVFHFLPKSGKIIKAAIRHLPINNSSQDTKLGLQELGYDTISVKQTTSKRPSLKSSIATIVLPLILLTQTQSTDISANFHL
jgi:hypothetical protein